MKLDELKEWIKAQKSVDYDGSYDQCGNYEETRIYENNGKFFRLEFMNGYSYKEYVEGKGFLKDEYAEPVEVFKRTRIEEYYETKEDSGEIYV